MSAPGSNRRLYGLHAGDGEVRYVGSTVLALAERRKQHLSSKGKTDTPVVRWMRTLPRRGLHIVLLAEHCTYADELAEIALRVGRGERLLNVIGGSARRYSR